MNWIKNTHLALVEFQRNNKTFYWALVLSFGAICPLLAWLGLTGHSLILGALATLVTGYTTLWLCASRWRELTARIDAADPGLWSVQVNGVRAGEISDVDYARILRTVEFDLRTYITQILHFITRIYRIFTHFVFTVPVVVFWAAMLFWLSSPSEFASTLDSLKTVTSSDLSGSLPTLASLVAMPIALYFGLWLMWRSDFRFSKFDDAIASGVLTAIGCPATGQVTLSQFRQGAVDDKFACVN